MMKRSIPLLLTAAVVVAVGCDGGRGPGSAGKPRTSDEEKCRNDTDPKMPSRTGRPIPGGKSETHVVVDAADDLGTVSKYVFGANHRFPYKGFGMWNSKTSRTEPLFTKRFRYSGLTMVRFPGGRTANNYQWQRAIGPPEDRKGNVDAAFGRTQIHGDVLSNEFGPDEYGAFLEEAGIAGNITVNFATGGAADAADWVEYMNTPVGRNPNGGRAWARVRAGNGHPEPYGITHWEIGNELAGEKTFWLGSKVSEDELAQKYIFGGSTRFNRQPVGTFYDYGPDASRSSGEPSQTFYVRFPPVRPGSEEVFVGDETWTHVSDLTGVGPDEQAYEIDYERGRIRFGDGAHGQIPQAGSKVTISHISGSHDGFNDFYTEMKSVDPTIKVGSGLNSSRFVTMMGSDHPYDFVVAHSYSYFKVTPGNVGELHDLMMSLPDEQAAKIKDIQEAIQLHVGSNRAEETDVVISEYAMATGDNIGLGRIDAPAHYTETLDGAIYIALLLRRWIDLGIPVAEKHTLIDINPESPPKGYGKTRTSYQAIIGPNPCFVLTSTAHVFRIFARLAGETLVASEVVGNPTRPLFTGATLQILDSIATIDESGELTLIVINKDRSRDITAAITTAGFDEDEARVWTLTGDYLAYNTPEAPHRVRLEETVLGPVSDGFAQRFPAHSVTAIMLDGE